MRPSCLLLVVGLGLADVAFAHFRDHHHPRYAPPPPLSMEELGYSFDTPDYGQETFQQKLDHTGANDSFFNVSYWWSTTYWKGPGSPVVFFTPGEVAGAGYTGYLYNRTITGMIAQEIGAATIVMEHRYWGDSSPFDELTVENLQYLTLFNNIMDTTYFANNVKLPFDPSGLSHPTQAPWVFSGGSYSGALSAYTLFKDPGTFWVHHASSAPVEVVYDFWSYFDPVRKGMAQNCSSDIEKVVDYMDNILLTGTPDEIQELKVKFGLGEVIHDDDFVVALLVGPWGWQANCPTCGYTGFYQWCDYIENMWPGSGNSTPGAEGVSLEAAFEGFAKWSRDIVNPSGYGDEYFTSYDANASYYKNLEVANNFRQWEWILCNEPFAFWQDGAPLDAGVPSIVSRLDSASYWQRQCGLYFPAEGNYTFGSALGKTPSDVNAWTGGWSVTDTTRLTYTNGEFDPWKDGTVSSDFRPGGPLVSTEQVPVHVVPGGIHCPDLIAAYGGPANPETQAIMDAEIATIAKWVSEFERK